MASNGASASVPVSPGATSRRPPPEASAQAIAEQFTYQYYTVFSNYPRYLHRFYDQASVQSVTEVGENGIVYDETVSSQKDIHDVILRLFSDAKAKVDHVSSQFSQNGGVMLQAMGTLYRRGCPDSNFVQSFFLAVQERGFFVLNDVLSIMPMHAPSAHRSRREQGGARSAEVLPQPEVTRGGMSFGAQGVASLQGNANGSYSAVADPDQINQILAETKQVLSATVPTHQVEQAAAANQHTYSEMLRKNSAAAHEMPSTHTSHASQPVTPFHGDTSPVSDPSVQSPFPTASSGFLLNPRRRNSSNSGMPMLPRNCSVFVREVPHNVEEKNLREIFEQFGTVLSVVIRTGKRDARFAFVDFSEASAMEKALGAELQIGGKRLLVQEKKPLVLRNKPRFANTRPSGDAAFEGAVDGPPPHTSN